MPNPMWGANPQQNPLTGSWPNPGGANPAPSSGPLAPPPTTGPGGSPAAPYNPMGFGDPTRNTGISRNLAGENVLSGQYRNQLTPLFAQLMQQFGGNAGDFFKQLTNLGSPFYQRKQQQSFEQGTKASQDAAAQSRQQLQASGQGYTPSGAGAAMFGGEAQAEAGNQEEAFLNNLFQNEQLQLAGAQGQAQLAGLFNPSQLTGQASPGFQPLQSPSFFQNFQQMMNGLFGQGGAAGGAATGSNIAQGYPA
jgi:hypothetical protein